MIKKTLIIASYTFRDIVTKGFFKIFTLVMTILILFGVLLPDLIFKLNVFNHKKEYLIYLVDDKNYIFDNHLDLNIYMKSLKDSGFIDGEYYFEFLDKNTSKNKLDEDLKEGIVDGYVFVNNSKNIEIITSIDLPEIKFVLDRFIFNKWIDENLNIDKDKLENILVKYKIENMSLNNNKIINIVKKYALPIILMMMSYMIFVIYGQFLSLNSNIEKNSKIVEILLTKVRLSNIILGKITGVTLVAFIQIVYFLSVLFLILRLLNPLKFPFITSIIRFDYVFIFRYILYFVFGFIIYSLIFLFIGFIIDKTENLSIASIPIIFMISLSYFISILSLQLPQSYFLKNLVYFPLFTPFLSIVNLSNNLLNEIVLCFIMILTILILVIINIKVFRFMIKFKGKGENKLVKNG